MIDRLQFDLQLHVLWQKIYATNSFQVPFLTYEWTDAWHKTIGKDWEPYILSINNEVIAPFARKGNEIIFSGGDEVADYLDIVGTDVAKEKAWPEILEFLKNQGVTSIHLNNIPESSPTISFFKSHASSVLKEEDTTPIIMLPATWKEYLNMLGNKYRHELERKLRKFGRQHSNIEIHDERDIDLLLRLMKLDERKKIFLAPSMESFFRKIMKQFQNSIVQTTLMVDGTPAATLLAFRVGDTLMSYNSGFDEQHFSGAGFYLKAMHIKRGVESGIKTYNFLQGNERYKYELGGKDFFVYRIDATM